MPPGTVRSSFGKSWRVSRFLFASILFAWEISLGLALCGAQPTNELYPPDDAVSGGEYSTSFDSSASRLEKGTSLPTLGGPWTSQGPGPLRYGQVENLFPYGAVTGAIHTVAAHPTNADILYVGSVNGGIWKTTNATSVTPTWIPLTDDFPSLSVGALEFDYNDLTHQTLVAGIGRYSSYSRLGGPRTGLLRTTDGGATWTEIDGGGTLVGKNISGVAARGNIIVISVNDADIYSYSNMGIFRSTDGGATFSQISSPTGSGFSGRAYDLVGHRNSPTVLYTGAPSSNDAPGIYKSTDTGASWNRVSDSVMNSLTDWTTNNIELAIHDAGMGTNAVYAAIINSGQLERGGLFRSANGGTSWSQMDPPLIPAGTPVSLTYASNTAPIVITSINHGLNTGARVTISGVLGNTAANGVFHITALSGDTFSLDGSSGNGNYAGGGSWTFVDGVSPRYKPDASLPGSQGYLHFSIAADPVDPFIVYVGGDRQDLPFPNYINAYNYTGNLWRGDASIPRGFSAPSPQWEHMTHSSSISTIPGGGTMSSSSPHADSREMVFDANGNLIETDDGGVNRRTNPASNTGDWFSICGNLQVTEQHDIAYCGLTGTILSGNQDTGNSHQASMGSITWYTISSGDGGDVAIDTVSMPGYSVRYFSAQYLQNFFRYTYDSNNNVFDSSFLPLTGRGLWSADFVSTVELNTVDPTRLVIGGANGILESTDQGETCTYLTTAGINRDCLTYGSNGNNQVLYAGSGAKVLVRLSGMGAPVETSNPFPGGTIRDLVVHPSDQNRCFVIDSDQIFETTDAGTTWTDRTGILANTDLRSIEFLPGGSPAIAVSGFGKVYHMALSSPGNWSELGADIPNVQIFDLDYDANDDVLVAGTLGRGAWSLNLGSLQLCETSIPVDCGAFIDGDTTGGQAHFDSYGCSEWNESGPENIYQITMSGSEPHLRATLSSLEQDLDVFILTACATESCVVVGDLVATLESPPAGVYYVVVDGYNGSAGMYSLSIDCGPGESPCEIATMLSCGNTIDGNNASGSNLFPAFDCISWNESGPEDVYQIQSTGSEPYISATLTGHSVDLDVFILGSCDVNDCLAYGDVTATLDSPIADTYYIVVDGYHGAVGDYSLTIDCGDPPPSSVWVDFAYSGIQIGTASEPYNSIETAVSQSAVGGMIHFYPGTTPETVRITKPLRLDAPYGGPVRIGVLVPPIEDPSQQPDPNPESDGQPFTFGPPELLRLLESHKIGENKPDDFFLSSRMWMRKTNQ